jgi:hypothetical protein
MEVTEKLNRLHNGDILGIKPTDSINSTKKTPIKSLPKTLHVSEEQEPSETSFKITHASE